MREEKRFSAERKTRAPCTVIGRVTVEQSSNRRRREETVDICSRLVFKTRQRRGDADTGGHDPVILTGRQSRPRICAFCSASVANHCRTLALPKKSKTQNGQRHVAKHRNKHEGSGKKQISSISPNNSFLVLPLSLNISNFPSLILPIC